jgi:hypothetical protein
VGLRKIKLIEGNRKFRSLKKIDLQKELFRPSLASVGLIKIKRIEGNGKFRSLKNCPAKRTLRQVSTDHKAGLKIPT